MNLKKCCCGCSLRSGAVIIGWILGIVSFLGFVITAVLLQVEVILHRSFLFNKGEEKEAGKNVMLQVMMVCNVSICTLCFIQLVVSIVLVYGASSERPSLLRIWICFTTCALILGSMAYASLIFLLIASGRTRAALQFVPLPFAISAVAYSILVVKSFRRKLIAENIESQNKMQMEENGFETEAFCGPRKI